ncbi:MAG: hypothetical protein ACREN8_12210 [Candidatus Dormibacteraceae bacterium]
MSLLEESVREDVPAAASVGSQRQLSADGHWWWNQERWVSAVTDDGLWRWDGLRWAQTVDLEGKRPEDLATTLTMLADRCYGEAGVLLSDRATEWNPDMKLRDLVREGREIGQRLRHLKDELTPQDPNARGGGLLGRRGLGSDERRQLESERESLARKQRVLSTRIGRNAPRPSLKEADDKLVSARLLEQRAALLTNGLASVDEAERMRADAAVAAQKQLSAAEDARSKALDLARKAVDSAESDHANAVAEARAHLKTVLSPGAGELKGGVGPLRLHSTMLETPAGRVPVTGCAAYAGTAPQLWEDHRETLHDLILLDGAEGQGFRDALTEPTDQLFLLVMGRTGIVLWPCTKGNEEGTRRFAEMVNNHAKEAERETQERDSAAAQAEQKLQEVIRDRSKVKATENDLARVERNPELMGAIDDARQRLERARQDTPELIQSRRKVTEIARRMVAPPDPLKVAEGLE